MGRVGGWGVGCGIKMKQLNVEFPMALRVCNPDRARPRVPSIPAKIRAKKRRKDMFTGNPSWREKNEKENVI